MANNRGKTMSEVTHDNSKNQQESGRESKLESLNETGGRKAQTKSYNHLRGASYMVLLIAAVFVINNAMIKSCCRPSWTLAIFSAALGFGLLAYSFYHKPHVRE